VEQNHLLVRNQSLSAIRDESFALLLAAHGERRQGLENEGAARLAETLRTRNVAAEICCGFIKGEPTVTQAILACHLHEIFVYPLLLSDGYFARVLLPQMIDQAMVERPDLRIQQLPPLGVDPRLADLVIGQVCTIAQTSAIVTETLTVVLCAHGSAEHPASRQAAERVASGVAKRRRFADVRLAFLEEPPALDAVIAETSGPVAVVGLFVGEGLHGGIDVPALIACAGRPDAIFAGNVGAFPGLADVVAAAVRRASLRGIMPQLTD
jgi:sirohydrochlorin ferrochelatase